MLTTITLEEIPLILRYASLDVERPWALEKMCDLLTISYQLTEHPFLKNWQGYQVVDLFDISDFDAEAFKRFNRTIIERTISQSEYYCQFESDYGILTMKSKGIEYAIVNVEYFYLTANKLCKSTEAELQDLGIAINHFRLTGPGQLKAAIIYFMEVCNDIIELILKHSITNKLGKIEVEDEKVKYLLRQKADLLQIQDQFLEKTYKNIINTIDIELGYHKQINEYAGIPAELKAIVTQFFAEKKARLSNNKLLGFLIEEKLEEFCSCLSGLVLELFSYHDVGTQEPEKVYHAFLLGVLNGFKDIYQLKSNKEAGNGRFDIQLIPETLEYKGMIIEIKRSLTNDEGKIAEMLDDALLQIVNNKYAIELKSTGHNEFISLAAVFHGKSLALKYRIDKIEKS